MKSSLTGLAALAAILGASTANAQTPIPPSPQDFVQASAQSDHYEMAAAHVALAQSSDERVGAFAQAMIRDHGRLGTDLGRAAGASGLEVPAGGMSSDQAMLLGALQSLRGTDFDKAYARQQVLAHTQAVAVEESFAASGADRNLQEAAREALPTLRDHLAMAKQLLTALGGS